MDDGWKHELTVGYIMNFDRIDIWIDGWIRCEDGWMEALLDVGWTDRWTNVWNDV